MRSFLLLESVLYADREGACMALGWESASRIIFYRNRTRCGFCYLTVLFKDSPSESQCYQVVYGHVCSGVASKPSVLWLHCRQYVGLQNRRMRVLFLAAVMQ